MLLTWPWLRRTSGRAARVIRRRPSTFVSHMRTTSSSLIASTGSWPSARPALLTSRSSRPQTRPTSATNASTLAAEVTSSSSPMPPVSSATRRTRSARRAPSTGRKPFPARARAVAAPMPLEPPVTTATRFEAALSTVMPTTVRPPVPAGTRSAVEARRLVRPDHQHLEQAPALLPVALEPGQVVHQADEPGPVRLAAWIDGEPLDRQRSLVHAVPPARVAAVAADAQRQRHHGLHADLERPPAWRREAQRRRAHVPGAWSELQAVLGRAQRLRGSAAALGPDPDGLLQQ